MSEQKIGGKAYRLYSQGLSAYDEVTAIPRNKYNFTVHFYLSTNEVGQPKYLKLETISNIQMPSFVYRQQTLNRYNAKEIIQTGIDYTPITMTAYDTKDAVFENFLKSYAEHYFSGPMNERDYNDFINNPKGLQLRNSKNYISTMTITRTDSANQKNIIEIFHPFITNADADTLDYSDSSPSTFRVSFGYEGYRIISGTELATRTGGFQESTQILEGDMGAGYYKNQYAVANPNGPPGSVYASNKPELYGYHPVGMETGSSHQASGGLTSETGSDFMFGDGDGVTDIGEASAATLQAAGGMTSETGSDFMFGDGKGVVGEGEILTEIDGRTYVKSSAIVKTSLSGKTGAQ